MIEGHNESGLAANLKTKSHTIVSGLSPKLGGRDEGPDPHELIEAGLAACTILTCQLYANRKGWSLASIQVMVRIEAESKELSKILRKISFVGDLTAEQKSRLFEIANKCPIHNLLKSTIEIESELI